MHGLFGGADDTGVWHHMSPTRSNSGRPPAGRSRRVGKAAMTTPEGPSRSGARRRRWAGPIGIPLLVGAAGLLVAGAQITTGAGSPADCPTGWSCSDIGSPALAGAQTFDAASGTWTITGGGVDITGPTDQFRFAWQSETGDASVSAHVVSQTASSSNAKSGVMLRASTDPAAPYYAVLVSPGAGIKVQERSVQGGGTTKLANPTGTTPTYLKVTRSANTFTAFTSADGATWAPIAGSTFTMNPGPTLLAGLAVNSHNAKLLGTATFQTVQVSGRAGAGPVTTTVTAPPVGNGNSGFSATTTTSTSTSTSTTTSTTLATPPSPAPAPPPPAPTAGTSSSGVSVCGTSLCVDAAHWSMYGSTIYNPGLQPYQSGIKDPSGTVALAEQAHLNTIRITDFLDVTGDPSTAPYDPTQWGYVDAMIAAAGAAGLHVDLGLSDYRATLWNDCINPYTSDWTQFVSFVANRVNTVTGRVYKDDPTIAFVSVAGEPLPVGTHVYTAKTTGQTCTMTYSTTDLTGFYAAVTSTWKGEGGTVLINSGGLGYLNESTAGIDWKTIFSLPTNDFCDIKTYGGMQAWAPTAAAFCQSIGKPVIVEEFGWQQGLGDAQRAQQFTTMFAELRALNVAGLAFWNLGYQLATTSYEVNPSTPLTFAAIVQNAP